MLVLSFESKYFLLQEILMNKNTLYSKTDLLGF